MSTHVDTYSDDAPGTDPDEDKLGVAPFAERLAQLLIALEAPNGYVIGLSGAWGSGKTTALNYVRTYLDRLAPQKAGETASIITIEFRPWLVSGHQDLVAAFFKVLAEQLGHSQGQWKIAGSKLADLGASVSGAVSKFGWLTALADQGALTAAGAVAGKGLSALSAHWAKEPSLQKTYEELHAVLKLVPQKIVVVVDDIDRLQTDEIRSMMMMVKTVGQLPNVVYLLCYDRNVVWPALQQATPAAARTNFADKIVQQEVALPAPGFERLVKLLTDEVAFLGVDLSKERGGALTEIALRRWLRTPRDVLRLANNLRFAWPVLKGYMDPVDYLAIEGVRTFEKALFDWIRDSTFLLFGARRHAYKANATFTEAQTFKGALPSAEADHTIELVNFLFPHMERYFSYRNEDEAKGKSFAGMILSGRNQVVGRRGLNFDAVYRAYFRFYKPTDVVDDAQLAAFMDCLEDESYLFKALKDATSVRRDYDYGWAYPLFETVTAKLALNANRSTEPLLRAAFRIYDELLTAEDGWGEVRPSWDALAFIKTVARDLPSDIVVRAFGSDAVEPPISFSALCLLAESVRREEVEWGLDAAERDEVVAEARRRIEVAARTEQLDALRSLHPALFLWPLPPDFSIPREWLHRHLEEAWVLPALRGFFVHFLERVLNEERVRYRVYSSLFKYVDIDELKSVLERHIGMFGDDDRAIFSRTLGALNDYQEPNEAEDDEESSP